MTTTFTFFRSGEVRHQLEFGEASGTELGKAYTVRVRAVNAGGPGPWSIESDQIVCRHKALKPKVTFRGPREVTLRAGETLSLAVDIQVQFEKNLLHASENSQSTFFVQLVSCPAIRLFNLIERQT